MNNHEQSFHQAKITIEAQADEISALRAENERLRALLDLCCQGVKIDWPDRTLGGINDK